MDKILYDMCLEKVEYTDNVELLSPQIFNISQQGIEMKSAQLGKYKIHIGSFKMRSDMYCDLYL